MNVTSSLPRQVNLRYFIDTRRYLTLAVAISLFTIGLALIAVYPQIQEVLSLVETSQQEETKVRNLEPKVADLEQMTTSPVASQMRQVDTVLPSKKPLLELLTSLNSVSLQSQVAVSNIELSPGSIATNSAAPTTTNRARNARARTPSKPDRNILSVDLTVQGDLIALNTFFELVEKTAPLTTISNLSLSPLNRSGNIITAGQFEAELTVDTYYYTKSVESSLEASLPSLSAAEEAAIQEVSQFNVPNIQPQLQIQGGGLEDLFDVSEPVVQEAPI